MDFLDTYALIAFAKGSYTIEGESMTFDLNLAELYYSLLRIYNEKTAEHFFTRFSSISSGIPREIIPEAMRFRHEQRDRKLSYADAIGYVYARKHGYRFVTGDKAFKGLKGVKIVG